MRHALGVLGVLAATVLLLVSAAMNWRFGYSLGHSELDSQLLGLASAAADGLKALIPFFLFAALRNKQWSQALAAGLLWGVCLTYSFTSALGFSAINRADTAGEKVLQQQVHADLRAELDKARERLGWIPQHRPAATVTQEIEAQKQNRRWAQTNGCVDATSGASKAFCQQYHELLAELGAAQEAGTVQARIDTIRSQLGATTAVAVVAGADPQVQVLSQLTGRADDLVRTGLILMVAVLVELGSSLGYFVVFSNWKLHGKAEEPILVSKLRASVQPVTPVLTANDNVVKAAPVKLEAPATDVERFHKERIVNTEGAKITATLLYEDYCNWCRDNSKEPLALPTFGREFGELGVHKVKFNGRMRYIGIKLKSGLEEADEHLLPNVKVA